jgi:phthiodiolone/phenolphthiodiolone dimycocerosates ketoreductase
MTAEEYRAKLDRVHAAAADAGRDLSRFEPALQVQLVLGKDRRTMLDQLVKVRTVGAMSMALPAAVWARHGLQHPLGEDFEGFPQFVPEELTPEQIDTACRSVTPELMADGVVAGNVDEVERDVRSYVAAGLRHLVLWNIGPLVTGAGLGDLVRLATLIRRLRRIPLPPRSLAAPSREVAAAAPLGAPVGAEARLPAAG